MQGAELAPKKARAASSDLRMVQGAELAPKKARAASSDLRMVQGAALAPKKARAASSDLRMAEDQKMERAKVLKTETLMAMKKVEGMKKRVAKRPVKETGEANMHQGIEAGLCSQRTLWSRSN